MMIFIILSILTVVLIVLLNINKHKQNKPTSFDYGDLLETKKNDNQTVSKHLIQREYSGKRWNDDKFEELTKRHQSKTLKQIDEYIASKQQNNDPYWGNNRMEYKVLMNRKSVLFNEETKKIVNLLSSESIYTMPFEELVNYYNLVRYNPSVYKNVNLARISTVLDDLSYRYYEPILKNKSPGTIMSWINARKNEGNYISDKLVVMAKEIESGESDESAYKRKLKNLQTKLSKAKIEGNMSKIESIKEEIFQFKIKH